MQSGRPIYRFGPYELDTARRRLRKGEERCHLPDRQMDVLICLVAHAGQLVDKETLIRAAWPDTAVGDGSIVVAVKGVRDSLGPQPSGEPHITTAVRKGYRFVAPVECVEPALPPISPEAIVQPHREFVDGRAALQTFDRDEVDRARRAFERALRLEPRFAAAHKGMATACVLAFDATRADLAPDVAQLQLADHHAREGCRLDPRCGDAWGALALVRHRTGNAQDALVAARTALSLDEADWRHHIRLAAVTWGQDRIRAAHRARSINPRAALAHWFAATVYVARGAFDHALDELRAGCALQDEQRKRSGTLSAVGLHWLHGLVLAATGAGDDALAELERELAATSERHVYGRESVANSWYARGALLLRHDCRDEAAAAFTEALTRIPGHPLALIGLSAARSRDGSTRRADTERLLPRRRPLDSQHAEPTRGVDEAIVRAAMLVLRRKHHDAARNCDEALGHAAPGSAGWLLPVEPILHVAARPEVWAAALGTLTDRAV